MPALTSKQVKPALKSHPELAQTRSNNSSNI